MLAYAANRRPAARTNSLRALAIVIAGHAILLAVVLTARGEMPVISDFKPTVVTLIDPPALPPPPQPSRPRSDTRSLVDTPPVIVPTPQPAGQPLDRGLPIADPTPFAGNAVVPLPLPDPPKPLPVRKAARFVTPADAIRPPYPESKRRLEEEANLRLALEIDARGRVVAVEPIGAADPIFLDAARRHILRRWRYQPATEDGAGVASRLVVTLTFELE